MNQIYRGKVWIICSEQFATRFFTSEPGSLKWDTDIAKARFYGRQNIAKAVLSGMRNKPTKYYLTEKELEYTNVIELNLVQDWPD